MIIIIIFDELHISGVLIKINKSGKSERAAVVAAAATKA
jgi:hypothetical protein